MKFSYTEFKTAERGLLILPHGRGANFKPSDFMLTTSEVAMIRIRDQDMEFMPLMGHYGHLLELVFDDCAPEDQDLDAFTAAQAQQATDFFKSIEAAGVKLLVVHCQIGVSRSPAIGIAYARFLEDSTLELLIRDSKQYVPNVHVLKTMELINV